jgi:c-di-GMP-binding flagellar brake protein YcgR
MDQGQNRRRYPRYPFNFPLTCEVRGEIETVRGINISEGGLLVAATTSLGIGSRVTLRFHLGNAGEISLQGTVRHAVEERHGTEFIELSEEDQQRLQDYIRQAASDALARL